MRSIVFELNASVESNKTRFHPDGRLSAWVIRDIGGAPVYEVMFCIGPELFPEDSIDMSTGFCMNARAAVVYCPHGPVCFSQPNFMVSRLDIDASERF